MKEIIESFRTQQLSEAPNTVGADINEIMFAYFAAGGDWNLIDNSLEAKEAIAKRKKQASTQQYEVQAGRAKAMFRETLAWALENGWDGKITKVWWTARPGILANAVGTPLPAGNPTDVLLQFGNEDFLGVSAKSTKSKGDIGFKNPGVGSISDALDVDLRSIIISESSKVISDLKLPATAVARKKYIRDPNNEEVRVAVEEVGKNILNLLREKLLEHLSSADEEEIRNHLASYWIDAKENYPYYIKVTGRGNEKRGYSASVIDPTKNEKYKALMTKELSVVPVGRDSIGIIAGDTRIMKMRFKYESQKLGSTIKMSGDSW